MFMFGVVLYGIWGFVYFAGLSTGSPAIVALVITLSFISHGIQYGPQGALIGRELPGTNTLQRLIDWLSACPSWAAAWLPSLQPHCWPGTAVAIWSPVTC